MAYRCKIFDAYYLTFHGHYTHVCTGSKVIGIDTENIVMSVKQGIEMSLMIKE